MPLNAATEPTLIQLKNFLTEYPHEDIADIGGAGYQENLVQLGIAPTVYDLRDGFDITKTPLPKKHKTIICLNTFEHIFDPVRAAENIVKSLKKGGYLFLTTLWKYDNHDYTTEDGFYVPDYYRFTEYALKQLFKKLVLDKCWLEGEGLRDFERVTLIAHAKPR